MRDHQAAFQWIAEHNNDEFYPGSRAAGTDGYDDSVDYVARELDKAGYLVTLEPVEFQFAFPAELLQLTPVEETYETGAYTGSGAGEVTGPVTGVDLGAGGSFHVD